MAGWLFHGTLEFLSEHTGVPRPLPPTPPLGVTVFVAIRIPQGPGRRKKNCKRSSLGPPHPESILIPFIASSFLSIKKKKVRFVIVMQYMFSLIFVC